MRRRRRPRSGSRVAKLETHPGPERRSPSNRGDFGDLEALYGERGPARRASPPRRAILALRSLFQDAELLESCRSIVQPNFLDDLAVLHTNHSRSRKMHLPAGLGRQRTGHEVVESGARMCSAARRRLR
jgi:hypothetical protein